MNDKHTLGPWVRRFLMELLPDGRNLSRNTQQSYRDALRHLIMFAAGKLRKKADGLLSADIEADLVRTFLRHLEEKRGCTISTRNQRLAAIHALASLIGQRSPEDLGWSAQVRSVELKCSTRVGVGYLEKREIDALLAAPDRTTKTINSAANPLTGEVACVRRKPHHPSTQTLPHRCSSSAASSLATPRQQWTSPRRPTPSAAHPGHATPTPSPPAADP